MTNPQSTTTARIISLPPESKVNHWKINNIEIRNFDPDAVARSILLRLTHHQRASLSLGSYYRLRLNNDDFRQMGTLEPRHEGPTIYTFEKPGTWEFADYPSFGLVLPMPQLDDNLHIPPKYRSDNFYSGLVPVFEQLNQYYDTSEIATIDRFEWRALRCIAWLNSTGDINAPGNPLMIVSRAYIRQLQDASMKWEAVNRLGSRRS